MQPVYSIASSVPYGVPWRVRSAVELNRSLFQASFAFSGVRVVVSLGAVPGRRVPALICTQAGTSPLRSCLVAP